MNVIPFPKRGIYEPKPPPTARQILLASTRFWIALWMIPFLMAIEQLDEMDKRE